MKKINLSMIMFLIIFLSCNEEGDTPPKPQSNSINKILNLGASRVEGGKPEYESYRYELWKKLKENNLIFDFVGTQTDESTYPQFNNMIFDCDHEGRGGWTSGDILEELYSWLSLTGPPDFVLFSSPAGNDALEGLSYTQAITNVNGIIDIIQEFNPNATIIIEQMAPARSDIMTSELTNFLEQIKKDVVTIAESKTTSKSEVIAVDMYSGFNDSLLADDVHYNQDGAKFIAERYFDLLVSLLE
tara:strand:+ start:2718 stop:3449 length:732 start_codon:yes stop_codon:yes gene_type:complete